MSYSPAPLALDRSKPSPWNASRAFVDPESQRLWRNLEAAWLFQDNAAPRDLVYPTYAASEISATPPTYHPSGEYGSWWEFDASNNTYFLLESASRINLSDAKWANAWSVRCILYSANLAAFDEAVLLGEDTSGSNWQFLISANAQDNQLELRHFSSSITTLTAPAVVDTWYDVVYTWDGTTARLYVDGVEADSSSTPGNVTSNPSPRPLVLSGFGPGGYGDFTGGIAHLAFWSRTVLPEEVARLYADPFGPFRPNWDYVTEEAGGTPGSASPATTGLSFAIPQATAASPGSASPDEIAPTVSTPAPGAAGSAAAEPDAITPTLSIEIPTPAGAAVAAPDAVSTSFTIPTPTAVEGEDAGTAQPNAISPTLTLPAPTPAGGAVTLPGTIAVTVVMPAPDAKGATAVTPDEIAVAVSLGAVTVEGGAVVTPDTITLTLTLPQATADGQVPAELIAQVINSTFGRQVVTGKAIRQAITGDTFIS